MERYSKKTIMMPVYSVQEGQNMGLVKSIIIDPKEKCIMAFLLERRRMTKEERIVPFVNIKSVGDNVIIIDKAINAERKNNFPQIMRYMRNPVQLIGSKVFTTGGKTLGRVEEYRYDDKSGKITTLEISGGMANYIKGHILLEGQYIITIAPATVMVDEEALEHIEHVENNPRFTMENAKEKAGSVLTGTIEASKKISQNISQTLNKKRETQQNTDLSPEDNNKGASGQETAAAAECMEEAISPVSTTENIKTISESEQEVSQEISTLQKEETEQINGEKNQEKDNSEK
ncbi:MAG: PRC-barrel domain-containing protein [Bacillota bacterium]